jgi:hypothetical protein
MTTVPRSRRTQRTEHLAPRMSREAPIPSSIKPNPQTVLGLMRPEGRGRSGLYRRSNFSSKASFNVHPPAYTRLAPRSRKKRLFGARNARSPNGGIPRRDDAAMAFIPQATRQLVQTVGRLDVLARVRAWFRKSFLTRTTTLGGLRRNFLGKASFA